MPLKMRKACRILSAFLGSFLILVIVLGYSQYLTLKKTLIAQVSGRATALIGQKVEIGDIFLDRSAGITITDIFIKNPDSFVQGDFLKIEKIRLDMRYQELFKGRFSFRSIEVASPELSVRTGEGRLNISDKFREFLSKKGTVEYLIDKFAIKNASFSFNDQPLYRVSDMNLSMNNLSSVQNTKTSFKASLTFWDSNKMTLEGWAYIRKKIPNFSMSAQSDNINLSLLGKYIAKYGIDLDKSRAGISIQAEGDTSQGIRIRTETELKNTWMSIFRKDTMHSISLITEAFLDINKEALRISRALFTAGDSTAIEAKGEIQDIAGTPSYSGEIRFNRLNLASFNFMKSLKVDGIITSDLIQVKGTISSALPQAAGNLTISNGAFKMDKADVQGLNGRIAFASAKDLSIMLGASARILKAGDALFRQPVEMTIAAEGKGKPGKIMLKSKLSLSGIDMDWKGKGAGADRLNAAYDGTVQGNILSGKVFFEAKEISYGSYRAKDLRTDLVLDYDSRNVTIKNVRTASDIFSAAGEMVTVRLPQGRGKIIMEAKNLSGSYPDKKAALNGLDCIVSLSGETRDLSGEISFTAQQVIFQDISSGPIIGKGSLASNGFILDLSSIKLFGGSVRALAKGKSATSPFPLTLSLTAENIDLSPASDAAKTFFKTPYAASGSAERLSFEGTISSPENVIGSASIKGKNISITNSGGKAMLKDAVVSSDIVFRGKDMDIRADASVAGLALTLSGSADRFSENDRALRLSILVPEVMISDIRAAFWDIVPDSLLYAGLKGNIALNLLATYRSGAATAEGGVLLRDIAIEGENNEYSLGPINGMVPIHFNSAGNGLNPLSISSFERTDFEIHKKAFAEAKQFFGNEIKIGSMRYGFRLLEDLSLWVEQKGDSLKINRFSANMFGGKVYGTGFVSLSDGLSYRAGIISDGVSLTQLCEEIPPIKGYISGRIDGIAAIKGSGVGLANIIGKADFWTYSTEGEGTRISREFLEKIGGPQVRTYLGERRFNKGIMSLSIQNGFFIFRDLEISNRNLLGITDLSVKVAPLNNRIAIDHLMWTVTEAAQRAKKE